MTQAKLVGLDFEVFGIVQGKKIPEKVVHNYIYCNSRCVFPKGELFY